MLEEFLEHLEAQVDRAIYVWGAQGQEATEDWIRRKESGVDRSRALKLYRKRAEQGVEPILAFDCSGLGMWFLRDSRRIFPSDMTANGMMGRCAHVSREGLMRGDWAFKVNSRGRATHIGYIVDDELNVVESRGRAYGVVKRPLSAGGWNRFGRPEVFRREIEGREVPWRVNRTLKKGCQGADVLGLQRRLMEAGLDLPRYGADGEFGTETEEAVIAYKFANGLTYTGKKAGHVTRTMIRRLGGIWKGEV